MDVAEEPEVQRAVDEACDRWSRAIDAWEALTWALMRDPAFGTALNEAGNQRALTLEGARSIDLPTVTARYRIETRRVVVERIRFVEARISQAGRC